jgi:arylsulfatase A-like enzyme
VPPSEVVVVHDLVAALPRATSSAETSLIDVGNARARTHLRAGWSVDEQDPHGNSFSWSEGESSLVSFERLAAGNMVLTARCRPFGFPGAPKQRVEIRLNGSPLESWALESGWGEYHLELPDELLQSTGNELELGYSYARSPHEVLGTQDHRDLAVAWDWFRLDVANSVAGTSRLRIDIGTQSARPHLVGGWSHDETAPKGSGFAWSTGDTSDVALKLGNTGPLELTFRAQPFTWDGAPTQVISVTINGTRVGDVTLQPGWQQYRVELTADTVAAGHNLIRFHYAYTAQPSEVLGTTDQRELGVAWDWISLESYERARADTERRSLWIPAGTRLDYDLLLPAGARFVADLQLRGRDGQQGDAGDVALVVILTDPAELSVVRHVFSSEQGGVQLLADDSPSGRVRLSLTPASTRSGAAVPGLWLAGPRIETRVDAGELDYAHPPPNVLLYVIGSLRADRLAVYGYGRETSPNLAALAEEGMVYERATAQSSWTKPSVASMVTGLHPEVHRVVARQDALSPELRTLPEVLRDAGYATAAVITNGTVSGAFGLDQGYADMVYLREIEGGTNHHSADTTNETLLQWLDRHPPNRPFFLYAHLSDPHAPYVPPPEYRDRFAASVPRGEEGRLSWLTGLQNGRLPVGTRTVAWATDLYDAEVAYTDAAFGRLVQGLQERGVYEDTMVIVVGDHGEEFHEHGGWQHGRSLYQEQLSVPLIIKGVVGFGPEPGRSRYPAQHIDLFPTVLDVLAISRPQGLPGRSLLGAPPEGDPTSAVFSSLHLEGRRVHSVIRDDWKLIRTVAPEPRVEVYDLSADPGEQTDLSAREPEVLAELEALLDAHIAGISGGLTAEQAVLDEDVERALKALGYLD